MSRSPALGGECVCACSFRPVQVEGPVTRLVVVGQSTTTTSNEPTIKSAVNIYESTITVQRECVCQTLTRERYQN